MGLNEYINDFNNNCDYHNSFYNINNHNTFQNGIFVYRTRKDQKIKEEKENKN
jgi:hypothetical protein